MDHLDRRQFLAGVAVATTSAGRWVSSACALEGGEARDEGRGNEGEPAILAGAADRDVASRLRPAVKAGRERIEQFFGLPYKRPFEIVIHPSRSAFDQVLRERYRIPDTQRWMVALGVAERMELLSPRVWKTEAVEHDPDDDRHVRELVAHEMVHVYHGQRCPRPDFDEMDELGWFVEGLAVLVSGQLANAHRGRALTAVRAGKAPGRLADAWSGRDRYGVSGSMVDFVDRKHGRAVVRKLLAVTSNAQAMALLGTEESRFLADWKADLTGSR